MARKNEYSEKYRPISGDVLGISWRIREIDPTYFLLLNRQTDRFEVHSSAQANTFCAVLPFEQLDERTVRYLRETRGERAEGVFEDMNRTNKLAEERQTHTRMEKAGMALEAACRKEKA